MKTSEINIRDPFVLKEEGFYYLYGTRAKNFGSYTGGFDVYISRDLEEWTEPIVCFDSSAHNMNRNVNWAPEVHKYKGDYYMFATFTMENGRRGTYILKAKKPEGPFKPHSKGAVTPQEWECLDGTLHIGNDDRPYIVFSHEHTQIIDGTVCYAPLNEELTSIIDKPVTLFAASSPNWADKHPEGEHYVTDGPFMYRTKTGELLMLWSTFIQGKYAECIVRFKNGEIGMDFEHLNPLIVNDGGHGMIFEKDEELILIYHSPNQTGEERPVFKAIKDMGTHIEPKESVKK